LRATGEQKEASRNRQVGAGSHRRREVSIEGKPDGCPVRIQRFVDKVEGILAENLTLCELL